MAKKKKKNGITTRWASDQCKTNDWGCYAVKRFSTKERTMLSFEQYGSFDIKRMFGDCHNPIFTHGIFSGVGT